MTRFTAAIFALLMLSVAGAHAETPTKNWGQWRGPLASGAAPDSAPPTQWSDTKNIRWKVAIPGRSHATPIIWEDRVYVLTAVKSGKSAADESTEEKSKPRGPQEQEGPPRDRPRRGRSEGGPPGGPGGGMPRQASDDPVKFGVLALDRKTGKTIWHTVCREAKPNEAVHGDATFASASPVTDGERIYAHFGSHGTYCLTLDGKVVWEKDLGDMETRNHFGEGSSPALYGDTLVITWDHEGDDFVVALDKKTGDERWCKSRDEPTTWATPLIVDVGGTAQVITDGTNRIRSYDLKTGEMIWDCAGLTTNVIPSPVAAGGFLYAMSGFRGAALKAVRLDVAKGDISNSPAIVWTYEKNTPYVPSPLLYDDALYFLDNNKGIISCLNVKTGAAHYGPQRIEKLQNIYASIVGGGGHVYVVGRDGTTVVLKHGPKFEVVATNKLDDEFDASPAIADKELYLRGRNLYCIAAD